MTIPVYIFIVIKSDENLKAYALVEPAHALVLFKFKQGVLRGDGKKLCAGS